MMLLVKTTPKGQVKINSRCKIKVVNERLLSLVGNGEIDFNEFLNLMTNTERFLESFGKYIHFVSEKKL